MTYRDRIEGSEEQQEDRRLRALRDRALLRAALRMSYTWIWLMRLMIAWLLLKIVGWR